MKKLKLKALQLGAIEVLTREQLKNVLGGDGSGSGDGSDDPSLLCYTTACSWYDGSTKVTTNGNCTWEFVRNPEDASSFIPMCYCKTDSHPHWSETTSPSKCNRF